MKYTLKDTYGSWGLVAGAAEGLGRAYSKSLAAKGMNVIMVDHLKDPLDLLARELEASFGIRVRSEHLDLASGNAIDILMKAVRETNCRLLIYNAAFSRVQKFMDNEPRMLDRYVAVNIHTPLKLVHGFCRLHAVHKEQRKGILLMSSLAGSWGTRLLGPYGGSKAFNHILAESLYFELKDQGMDVLACIAGATATPAYLASLPEGKRGSISVMDPAKVAEAGLGALGHRPFVVAGFKNRCIYLLMTRILPRRTSLRIMNRAVGQLYNMQS
jgi:short-subunit dehydrogenase